MVDENTNLFRVTGRVDHAIFIHGVWLAIPELENSLVGWLVQLHAWCSDGWVITFVQRASQAGTDIIDAQIVKYEEEHEG